MRNSARNRVRILLAAVLGSSILLQSPATAQMDAPELPVSWLGTWEGEMTNYGPEDVSDPIAVTLRVTVLDDGSYEWRTVYNEDVESGLRDYRLIPVPGTASDFVLDEKNGILLQARMVGGSLVTPFNVGGRTFLSRYTQLEEGHLVHEIFYWSDEHPLQTTGTGAGGEGGQPVSSMAAGGIQRTEFSLRR